MTRYTFDRLGDNTAPPMLDVPDGAREHEVTAAIEQHARKHIQGSGDWAIDPRCVPRKIGGYEIRSRSTSYTYGTARRAPVFAEDPFLAAAAAAFAAGPPNGEPALLTREGRAQAIADLQDAGVLP